LSPLKEENDLIEVSKRIDFVIRIEHIVLSVWRQCLYSQ